MSYLAFLCLFVVPPLVFVAVAATGRVSRAGLTALAVYVLLAVAVTAPWDAYLIASGVWRHGDVLAQLGRVPLEEYAFMVGQALGTGLLTLLILPAHRPLVAGRRVLWTGVWLAASMAAWLLHPLWTHGFYLTAIVGWYGPLLALQAAVGADRLAAVRRARLAAVAIPTGYLWLADRIAIGQGTWWINPDLTLPFRPFGLPWEEALFFLLTNLVLVNGLALATDPLMWQRVKRWRGTSSEPDQ